MHEDYKGYLKPLRQKIYEIYTGLRSERLTWRDRWQENARFVSPARSRFEKTQTNKGPRKNRWIIDGKGTRAARTAVAGMSAGITPSSRPWFNLSHANQALREIPAVKEWLHFTEAELRMIFAKSNFYQAKSSFYLDLITFSNACLFVEKDKQDVMRFTSIPVGEWFAANDHRMQVKTFMREFRLTVRQTVEKFCKKTENGYDFSNVTTTVKRLFLDGHTDSWVDIVHVICPNDQYDNEKIGFRGKKYLSVYYEEGVMSERPLGDYGASEGPSNTPLSLSGYDLFPVLVGRWGLVSGDVYGSWGPTDVAIGDVRELQYFARMQATAIQRQVNPELVGSSRLKRKGRLPDPGDVLWLSDPKHADSLRRIFDFQFDVAHGTAHMEMIKQSVSEAFYEDVFKRFLSTQRQYMTAKQVAEESEEKLTELAPMLQLLNHDVLDPVIDLGFYHANEAGRLPEAPEELQGEELSVEYVSTLHQAQKLLNAGSVERFTSFIGSVAGFRPEVMDKVDENALVEEYADVTSLPPGILRDDNEVAQIREQRAAQQQQTQEIDDAAAEAQIAKDLGAAKLDENRTALSALVGE